MLNQPFLTLAFDKIFQLKEFSYGFVLSIPFTLLSILIVIFSFFSIISTKHILKPVLIFFTLISSLVFYATYTYGIVFDDDMLVNIIETNNSEAFSYINIHSVFVFFITGLVPSFLILLIKINYQSYFKEIYSRIQLVISALLIFFIIAYFFYANYASFGRNNHQLKNYIVPTQISRSTYKVIKDKFFTTQEPFKILDKTPLLTSINQPNKNVIVMVIGETSRAKNYTYNGYERETNAFTKKFMPIFFKNMTSCGTATAVSVPCLFSSLDRENFDINTANNQQNILDIAKLSGIDVLWVDNDHGCKNVCKRVKTINISTTKENPLCDGSYCFDEILLAPLKHKLNNLTHQTTLIVLHMIGSHGPTYYRRYPEEMAKFLPDCRRSDIQNCTEKELVNTYDNTIVYTDFILSKVITNLTKLSSNINSSMLFVSDHGESLGEHGAYLHGFPYAFAPKEQTHVPLLFWSTAFKNTLNKTCLGTKAKNEHFSHDNMFSTTLGLLQIKTPLYSQDDDIFSHCKNGFNRHLG